MSKVFSFVVIRPPESIDMTSMKLPSIDEIGGEDEAKALSSEAERMYQNNPVENSRNILRMANPKTLSALLRYSNDLKLINHIGNVLTENGSVSIENMADIVSENNQDNTGIRKSYFGPVGVGDLKLVEEFLTGYSMGEVAHIENIMAHEKRERIHKVSTSVENIFSEESEMSTLTEEDLQTSERFSLQSATQSEIESRVGLQAGLEISGKYGPTVEVKSKLDFSMENSKRQASQQASQFARDVIEKSVERTEETIRKYSREVRRTITEHTNQHGFDNTAGNENKVGIYRYVNKNVTMKVVDAGKRFFYEFIVPEPGAYLRELNSAPKKKLPQKPSAPIESVDRITVANYPQIMKKYNLSGVMPPPDGKITLAETFGDRDSGNDGGQRFLSQGTFEIEDGYMATSAEVKVTTFDDHSTDPEVWVTIGGETKHKANGWPDPNGEPLGNNPFGRYQLDKQRRKLSYTVYTRHDSIVQISIEVTCEPTPEAIREWQHRVYDAIQNHYKSELAEYESRLAEAMVQDEDTLDVTHPLRLKEMEKNELKRLCLQMLGQVAEIASPLDEGGLPLIVEKDEAPLNEGDELIDISKLEELTPEIRFGETAFEWHNLQYTLYPYYWTSPKKWKDLAKLKHSDRDHAMFLSAGAARILVPVRDAYIETLASFLQIGRRALDRLDHLEITDKLWVPLLQEIKESQGQSNKDRPVIDCWNVTLPTNLVMLDPSQELPEFEIEDNCPRDDNTDDT